MRKQLLLLKTLLVAVLLGAGTSASWAQEYEWQLAWADYFEDAEKYTTNTSWSATANLTISQNSRADGVSGKYYRAYDSSANGRTLTYSIGNAYTASGTSWPKYTFAADEAYKLEFDAAFRCDRIGSSGKGQTTTFTIPNLATISIPTQATSAKFTAINAYNTISAGDELFAVNIFYSYTNSDLDISNGYFYHFVVEGRSTGTTLTVYGPYSEGSYSNTPVYSGKLSGSKIDVSTLSSRLARYCPAIGLDNIVLYKEVDASVVETPTAAITAVDGNNRTVTFSCATDGVTLSYSTDGGSSFTNGTSLVISENTDIIVRATKGVTTATSETLSFEAGTKVTLNTPGASVTTLTLNNSDGLYYPTVNGTYNVSGVLLEPTAILSAKFNGSAVSLPYAPTTTGTLVITASYDGYESKEYNYNVVGYAKVLWKDYTTLESLSGVPSGLRKWSGADHWELAEGYGLKAIRTDNNAWCQIDRAGMIAYDVLSEASANAETTTIILTNNHNTGNDDLQYFSNGKVLSKIYYFTEGRSRTISDAKYATYCSPYALDFSGVPGLKAYIAVKNNSGDIEFTQVSDVPANTGVLLKGDAGNYAIPVIAESTTDVDDNEFVGVTQETEVVDAGIYVLLDGDSGVGFYKTTTAFTVGANTAYLPATVANAARKFIAFDDNGVTAIKSVKSQQKGSDIYNLQGQRVKAAKRGLYIVNGKKVIK